jgi:hypothetical protein
VVMGPKVYRYDRLRSPERDGIATLNRAALDHIGIDPHIRVIVLRCGAIATVCPIQSFSTKPRSSGRVATTMFGRNRWDAHLSTPSS